MFAIAYLRRVLLVLGFAITGVLTAEPPPSPRVAYVDLKAALDGVEAGKTVKKQILKEMTAKQILLEKNQAALEKHIQQIEKSGGTESEMVRAELQRKTAELQRAFSEMQTHALQRESELTKPVMDDLRIIIEGLAKKRGFQWVLEKNEGVVLFAQNSMDLTTAVIETFNARTGKKK